MFSVPLISNSSSSLTKALGIVPSAPITIGITITLMLHSFFSSLARFKLVVGWLVGWLKFYGISIFVGYLTPNYIYIYIYIYYIYIYIYTFNLSFLSEYVVDKKILISRISFVCIGLNSFNSSYFWYNPVSLRRDRTLFILTLSNRSLKRFTLKNRFLVRADVLHSMRTFLEVQGV